MMIKGIDQAREALADTIWFLKGLAAVMVREQTRGDLNRLETQSREARIFLSGLTEGTQRYVGRGEGGSLIVLTLPELERVMDLLSDLMPRAAEIGEQHRVTSMFEELRKIAKIAADQELADQSQPLF